MIRAIITDLGGVLLHNDFRGVAVRWEAELGLPAGQFLGAVFGGSDDTVLIGRVPEAEWWDEVCRRLGVDRALLPRIEAAFGERERWDREMAEFLASLRPSCRLALLSNAWPRACERARTAWKLDELFHEVIFSCDVGLAKPDARIYHLACERLGVEPAEAVFVDDNEKNVEGAAAVDMHAVLFRDTRQAIDEVRELLGRN